MKTKFILIVSLFAGLYSFAQQDPQYTQYMYNTVNVNPAYAGSRGVTSIFGLYRAQWIGLDGAPETATVSLHAPVGKNVGLGFSVINDRIGPMDNNTLSGDFSYTLKTSENWKLALGIKAKINLLNVDYNKLSIRIQDDVMFANNINNDFSPNVGAGLYWYSDRSYIGLSVPSFIETEHYSHNDLAVVKERLHFYLIGGHVFNLSYNWQFKPAVMIKTVSGSPLQADVSANFLYDQKLTLGLAYRWDAAFSALAGFQITDGFFAGYAYDMETTRLQDYNSGSHEIFLRFELFNKSKKIVNPRFF
ncbi:MAG TPA: type IX secretion system membrane protein PorP/SprF [Flavobacterium sp.]|nr:type IX secretion system membrane protein PorP/SprF [Flavobacterium sp.]